MSARLQPNDQGTTRGAPPERRLPARGLARAGAPRSPRASGSGRAAATATDPTRRSRCTGLRWQLDEASRRRLEHLETELCDKLELESARKRWAEESRGLYVCR